MMLKNTVRLNESLYFIPYIIYFIINRYSQKPGTGKGDSTVLEELFNRLVDNYDDNDRIRINDSIRLIIDSYVKSDTVFNHRFTNLRYLGQIMSPDSLIKIITWNLVLANKPGTYFCYFIKKQESGKENRIYRLSASYNQNLVKTDTIYTESDWYGALYYDLKPFIIEDKQMLGIIGN